MIYKEIQGTGEKISAIGLGCMGMSMSYGKPDDAESIATLNLALDLGINFWDTADVYGNGHNERLIGEILKIKREKVFIATKLGFVLKESSKDPSHANALTLDGNPKRIKYAVEQSLKNLCVDTIDLLYLHRVDPKVPVEETVNAMGQMVKEGKVRYLGLSECTCEDLEKANKTHKIFAVQSEYSLLSRQVEENGILELTKKLGIFFVPFAPFARGLMTNKLDISTLSQDDFRIRLPRYQDEYLVNNQKLAAAFEEFAFSKNATAAQLAIAWVMAQGEHIIPIPGTKKQKYLKENALAYTVKLNAADIIDIQSILNAYPLVGERYSESENKFLKK